MRAGVLQLLAGGGRLLLPLVARIVVPSKPQRLRLHELHFLTRSHEDEKLLFQQLSVLPSEVCDGAEVRAQAVEKRDSSLGWAVP